MKSQSNDQMKIYVLYTKVEFPGTERVGYIRNGHFHFKLFFTPFYLCRQIQWKIDKK